MGAEGCPGRKRSPGAPVGAGAGAGVGMGMGVGVRAGQLELPASLRWCWPAIWSCSIQAPGILQRTLHFREWQVKEILDQKTTNSPPADKWTPVLILPLTSAFCFYKSMGEDLSLPIFETYSCIQSLILLTTSDTFMPNMKNIIGIYNSGNNK